ncbi:MAG: hypothetical protein LBU23_08625, partial [Planctomycetota bacterium]|nr:hypothetical protein [Planctomycetota bacterium]
MSVKRSTQKPLSRVVSDYDYDDEADKGHWDGDGGGDSGKSRRRIVRLIMLALSSPGQYNSEEIGSGPGAAPATAPLFFTALSWRHAEYEASRSDPVVNRPAGRGLFSGRAVTPGR